MTNLRDWLFADDLDGHEWLIHRAAPRFIARIVDDQGGEEASIHGLTVSIDEGQSLSDFQFIGPAPTIEEWQHLLPQIRVALAAYEERLEADIERLDDDDA